MISLEDVRKQNKLSLQELGMAINSLWINPEGGQLVTPAESKRIADWAEGYREFDFQEVNNMYKYKFTKYDSETEEEFEERVNGYCKDKAVLTISFQHAVSPMVAEVQSFEELQEVFKMFTYKTLSKEKGVATIELINNQEEMYVPAQPAKNKDYSNFTI